MYKFLCSIIIITSLSLSYVHQRVELFEYSYRINDNHKRLCLLIDRNEGLRYNVASLKAPHNLRRELALNNIELDTPQNWHNIRLASLPAGQAGAESKKKKELTYDNSFRIAARALINILAPKAEAIAQELNQP